MGADFGKVTIRVDEFLTATRVPICAAVRCRYNMMLSGLPDAGAYCSFKRVVIGAFGECESADFTDEVTYDVTTPSQEDADGAE